MPRGKLVKGVWFFSALIKLAVSVAFIVILSLHLHNTSVPAHDADGHAVMVEHSCLLGWETLRPSSLCVYGYFTASMSIFTSFVLGLVLVSTCGLFGISLVCESALSCCGGAWWGMAAGIFTHYAHDADHVDLPNSDWRHAIFGLSWLMTAVHVALAFFYAAAAYYFKTPPLSRLFVDKINMPILFDTYAQYYLERSQLSLLSRDPAALSADDNDALALFVTAAKDRARDGTAFLVTHDPHTAPALFRHHILHPTSLDDSAATDMEHSLRVVSLTLAVHMWKVWNTGLLSGVLTCLAAGAVTGCAAGALTWVWLTHALDETYSMDVWLISSAVGLLVSTATTAFFGWGKYGQTVAENRLKDEELAASLRGKLSLDEPTKSSERAVEKTGDEVFVCEKVMLVWDVVPMEAGILRWYKDQLEVAAKLREVVVQFPRMRYIAGDGNCAYRAAVAAILEGLLKYPDKVDRLVLRLQAFHGTAACGDALKSACDALCATLRMARYWSADNAVGATRALLNDPRCASTVIQLARMMVSCELQRDPARYGAFLETAKGDTVQKLRDEVEVMGTSGDHVHLTALMGAWGLDVALGVVDVASSETAMGKLLDETAGAGAGAPVAWVLHTPNHWGVIYPGGAYDVVEGKLRMPESGKGDVAGSDGGDRPQSDVEDGGNASDGGKGSDGGSGSESDEGRVLESGEGDAAVSEERVVFGVDGSELS